MSGFDLSRRRLYPLYAIISRFTFYVRNGGRLCEDEARITQNQVARQAVESLEDFESCLGRQSFLLREYLLCQFFADTILQKAGTNQARNLPAIGNS
jgi:hypothetical protein